MVKAAPVVKGLYSPSYVINASVLLEVTSLMALSLFVCSEHTGIFGIAW